MNPTYSSDPLTIPLTPPLGCHLSYNIKPLVFFESDEFILQANEESFRLVKWLIRLKQTLKYLMISLKLFTFI